MGYQVENYSLNELHRIAVPGSVPPTLFGALPVGRWDHVKLDRVWRWFTKNPSECNDFGLLLVKSMDRPEHGEANVDLGSVGAKLFDLMPAGSEQFIHPRDKDRGETPKVLVLSGGYPQPGWGVLVEGGNASLPPMAESTPSGVTRCLDNGEGNPGRRKDRPVPAGSSDGIARRRAQTGG